VVSEDDTVLLYRDDPYLLEFDARVVERREHGGRPAVVLDRTAFYAESGGQPWDTGTLGGVRVLEVQHDGGRVVHVLDASPAGDLLHGVVDAARRRDHLQQHHGQHLLSRAFADTAAAATVSFHLGESLCSIDLDRAVSDAEVRAAEARANAVVAEARPVAVSNVDRATALALGVRVPDEAGDRVRLVDAEGFDRQACSGTHPRRTSEVGTVLVLGHERYKAGTRVRFVCGARAQAAVHARVAVLDGLSQALSVAWADLPEAVARVLDERAALTTRAEELRERALAGEAAQLLAAHPELPAVVWAVYDGRDAGELRGLAEHLVAARPAVALLASRGAKVQLVFARSKDLPVDVSASLKATLAPAGGRGGGRPELAQGGCLQLPALEETLQRLAAEIRAAVLPIT
jgi:alanyl-tRNA synthetase